MRPVRGAPKWEWDAWLDDWSEAMSTVEPPRVYPKAREPDALDEMQARSPITRYLSGVGSVGVEYVEGPAPNWPAIQEAD